MSMDELAMHVGYLTMAIACALIIHSCTEIAIFKDVKKLIVLGFGPVWFRVSETGPLYSNMRKIGFRIWRRGDWVFGLSLPRWLGKIVRARFGV